MHTVRFAVLLCCVLSAGVLTSALALTEVYHVGPGDVLSITVYDQPDLSVTVRVSGEGSILVPLIGQVMVSGKSVSEIAKDLEERFADGFLVNPHVNVFVEEFQGRKAVVLGQVNNPGMVELKGPITLLELISKAGGLTDSAGSTAVIRRTGADGKTETIKVDLKKLLEDGDLGMNIPIEDRDHVFIDKVEQYYIMGEVRQPGPYLMHKKVTVFEAVTLAGGFTSMAAEGSIRIQRMKDGRRVLLKNVKQDTEVMPDDVIIVPESFF